METSKIPKNKKYITQEKVEKVFQLSIKELEKFFGIDLKENPPNYKILESRAEIDKYHNSKTPDWVVAFVTDENKDIYLLAHEKIETESSHKYRSIAEFEATIKHELCHIFCGRFCRKELPRWVGEGISLFLAKQDRFRIKPKVFKMFLKSVDKAEEGVYDEAGFAIELLVENFGKDKLLELLKTTNGIDNYENFKNEFKELYGFKLDYKGFNKLLNQV